MTGVRLMKLVEHLSTEELKARYKTSKEVKERLRWQVLWLISQQRPTREVSEIVAVDIQTVRRYVWDFNKKGPEAVTDHRKLGRGGVPPLLDAEGMEELRRALEGPPPDGGLWNGPKVAAWLGQRVGRTVSSQTGWRYLHKAGWTLQSVRPASSKANPAAQEAFKKSAPRKAGERPERRGRQGIWVPG